MDSYMIADVIRPRKKYIKNKNGDHPFSGGSGSGGCLLKLFTEEWHEL